MQQEDGKTALHSHIESENVATVEMLANDPRVRLDIKTKDGKTPFDYAKIWKNEEILEIVKNAQGSRKRKLEEESGNCTKKRKLSD